MLAGASFDLDGGAGRQRQGVGVGLGLHTALVIQLAKAHLDQVEALTRQLQQMLAFDGQRVANGLVSTVDRAPQVLLAASQQQRIEFIQITHRRHCHEVVPSEEPSFAFDATLFMALARRTEAGFKSPMRAKRGEARRLLAAMAAQDLFDRCAQVVVPQPAKGSAQVLEPEFVRFQERLLGRPWIGAMKRCAAGHGAYGKDLDRLPFTIEVRLRFVPVDLAFLAPRVLLRDVHLWPGPQPHRKLPLAHVLPHRRLRNTYLRTLFGYAHPDAVRGVALLARCASVRFQDAVDELGHAPDLWPWSVREWPLPWNGTRQCLAHQPTVHSELARYARNAANAELVFPSKLLE